MEDDISCSHYAINELKKKLKELKEKKEEFKKREQIVRERLKIEGKIELELVGLEFNQDRWLKTKDE